MVALNAYAHSLLFEDTLHFLANHLDSPDWRRLGEHLPVEWIEQAVERTYAASIRHRRLPAEQVVWLMVALFYISTSP